MGSATYFIAATRNPDRASDPVAFSLTCPLEYPDPADSLFGYARHPLTARDGTVHPTTRMLVRTVLAGANAMVAWKARRFVASKADVASAYREHVGSPWADLVEDVDRTCRVELRYLVPEDGPARRRLREMCGAVLPFENYILEQYRAFMLDELATAQQNDNWVPAELAGWLLESSPDDVQAAAARGAIASMTRDGRRLIAERSCLQRWAATMLDRVLHPGDTAVADSLDALASTNKCRVAGAASDVSFLRRSYPRQKLR